MFDRIEDVFVAVRETGRGWEYELVEAGRDDDQDEGGEFVIEYGDSYPTREAARRAGEHLMGEYLSSLDDETRERIRRNRES